MSFVGRVAYSLHKPFVATTTAIAFALNPVNVKAREIKQSQNLGLKPTQENLSDLNRHLSLSNLVVPQESSKVKRPDEQQLLAQRSLNDLACEPAVLVLGRYAPIVSHCLRPLNDSFYGAREKIQLPYTQGYEPIYLIVPQDIQAAKTIAPHTNITPAVWPAPGTRVYIGKYRIPAIVIDHETIQVEDGGYITPGMSNSDLSDGQGQTVGFVSAMSMSPLHLSQTIDPVTNAKINISNTGIVSSFTEGTVQYLRQLPR